MYQQNLNSLFPRVLQYPGNEAEFRSDKNKHRRPNSGLLIWGVHPLVLVARLIFRAGKFRPRPETIFHLQWTKYICIASLNLHEGFIWQNAIRDIGARRCHRGTFVLLREGDLSPNPAILLPIVYLNIISLLFPNMLATSNQIESYITKKKVPV